MGFIIEDGRGNGFACEVTDEFRLSTEAKARPSEEVEAEAGKSFILHGRCHTAAAASGALMAFTNTSNLYDVVISRIYIDAFTITPTDLIVTQIKAPTTLVSGTDISTTGIVQKNYGSAASLNGVLKISNAAADLTFTGGTEYHAFSVKTGTSYFRDMSGTNVVTPQSTILWGWSRVGGGNATDAEIISMSVNCFIRKIGSGVQ